MTSPSNEQASSNGASNGASSDTDHTVKTALDCDILTVVRDAHAHEEAARKRAFEADLEAADPMDKLYKPLGNKDVACVLNAAHHKDQH